MMSRQNPNHKIKSCGKNHPYCRSCRPEVAAKTARGGYATAGISMVERCPNHREQACGHFGRRGWNKGLKTGPRSIEVKRKIAVGVASYSARFPKEKTPLEYSLSRLLTKIGFEFEEQKWLGRCVVDAYDPENGLVWEADGAYWHQDKEKERARDAYLIEHGVSAVIHLSEDDLKGW